MFTFRFKILFNCHVTDEGVTAECLQFETLNDNSKSKYISLKFSLESSFVQTIENEKSLL